MSIKIYGFLKDLETKNDSRVMPSGAHNTLGEEEYNRYMGDYAEKRSKKMSI